jgi:uncharacterized protein (TIGR04222 family)
MNRKQTPTFVVILLISLFVFNPVYAAKSYDAERFDVQIDLQENGSAIITETVEFHFSGGPFTNVFRNISATETDGVTFLSASMDGTPMPQGAQAGQVEVEAGDPLKVTWHFSPTFDTTHVFVVRYRANGVVRKGAADTLIWRAVPEEHEYSIARSMVTLIYPSKATLLEQPSLSSDFESAQENDRFLLTAGELAKNHDLILTAKFSPGSLARTAPQWQAQKERADAATAKALPIGAIAGLATLILGGLGLFTYARANDRELKVSPVVSNPNPPSDISPAIIGKLTGQGHHFMGAIFDLAQRGVLEVREEKGFLGTKNHLLVRKENTVALKPFEQGLLDALFKYGETQINLNEVATRLGMKSARFDDSLDQELVQRGWLDRERKRKRTVLLILGLLALFLAMIVFIFSMIAGGISLRGNTGWILAIALAAGIGAGSFILSILFLIYAGSYSVLTSAGEEQAARWKGFKEYLKQASKGKEPAIRPDYFERYLAYAAVFGLGASWAKYFQKLGSVPLPIWFHAMVGSEGDFGAIVAVMSASDSAGASAGAGGGTGASGGGSSGAG